MRLPLRLREWREGLARGSATAPACAADNAAPATSWPPAWGSAVDSVLQPAVGASAERAAEHHRAALAALALRPDAPIALAVSVPFCVAQCLCCDRPIHAAQPPEVIDDYVDGLVAEVKALAAHVGGGREVLQLHLGGGTANELSPSQLMRLMQAVHGAWRLPADAEMSADCDPRRAGWSQLELLRGLGFRRVAFGVFDLAPEVQQAIGRRQSEALVDDVCELARASGMETITLGLMSGLPHQSESAWRHTLQRVLAMAPDRVSLSCYQHHPWVAPAQCAIDAEALPDAQACRALSAQAADMLCDAGYRRIGAELFVLDSDELVAAQEQGQLRRNLVAYTATPPAPVLGVGAGAVGEVDGHLFWNETPLPAWRRALREGALPVALARPATEREMRRRQAVDQLLCRQVLPRSAFEGVLEDAWHRLVRHEAEGLVQVQDDRLVVTPAGHQVLLALCHELDDPMVDGPGATRWLS